MDHVKSGPWSVDLERFYSMCKTTIKRHNSPSSSSSSSTPPHPQLQTLTHTAQQHGDSHTTNTLSWAALLSCYLCSLATTQPDQGIIIAKVICIPVRCQPRIMHSATKKPVALEAITTTGWSMSILAPD